MTTDYAIDLVQTVNDRLDPQTVLNLIDFHADKVQQAGDVLKAFCPIHKDSRFRSLLLDEERRAFRCTIKTCAGYHGGSLVELYAAAQEVSVIKAACDIAQQADLPLETGWLDQVVSSYVSAAEQARQAGDFTEAQSLLQEVTEIVPARVEPRMMLAALHDEMGNSAQAAEEYVKICDDAIENGQLEEANRLIDDALNRFPDNEDVRFASIRAAEAARQPELVISRMEEVLALRDSENRPMDNVGLLEQLVEKAPDRPDFAIRLGGLYEQQHNMRAASRQYEVAAQFYVSNNQTAEAVQWLERVVQFNAENSRARLGLAQLLLQTGDTEGAREHTFRVINQHIDQQEFGPAVTAINLWMETEPDSIQARELMGRVFLEQERHAEAAAFLAEGAQLASDSGDHDAAADLLLRAKYIAPDDANLRRQLIAQFDLLGAARRAAFERIDLAEILFAADAADEAIAALNDGITRDVPAPLRLQMIIALVNHRQYDLAQTHLQSVADTINRESPEEYAEFLDLQCKLEPLNVDVHLQRFDVLWQVSPGRALEAAIEAGGLFLKEEQRDSAVRVIETAAQNVDQNYPESVALMKLAAAAGRLDLAGAVYSASIQGLAEEDLPSALATAQWMISTDPQHPSAPSDVAYLLAAQGRADEASAQYVLVARALRDGGDHETALQYAYEATNLNPGSIPALSILALSAAKAAPQADAEATAQNLLSALDSVTDAEAAATGYLAVAELFPEAEELLLKASEALLAFGSYAPAARLKAQLASLAGSRGDWESAVATLVRATDLTPGEAEIWEQLGEAQRLAGQTGAPAFAQAALLYAENNIAEDARRCILSANLSEVSEPKTWETLFRAANLVEDSDSALRAATALTQHFLTHGPPASALRWAREVVKLNPEDPTAHSTLGAALTGVDQAEESAAAFSRAGKLFLAAGRRGDAVDAVRSAVSNGFVSDVDLEVLQQLAQVSDPQDTATSAEATRLWGRSLVSLGHIDDAVSVAGHAPIAVAAELWPTIAKAAPTEDLAVQSWIAAADALAEIEQPEQGVEQLREALTRFPENLSLHRVLGNTLAALNFRWEALPHRLKVLRWAVTHDEAELNTLLQDLQSGHGNDGETLARIGQVLVEADRRELALPWLESAAELELAAQNSVALVKICSIDEELTRQSSILTRARADALMGMENEQQALEWIAENARKLLAEGQYAEACEMAERWVRLRPRDVEGRKTLAAAFANSSRVAEADEVSAETAAILLKSGEAAAAAQILQSLNPELRNTLPILRRLAEAQRLAGDPTAAAETLYSIGEFLADNGEAEKAAEAYGQSAALAPDYPEPLRKQADLTLQLQGTGPALTLYRKWLQLRRAAVTPEAYIQDLQYVVEVTPASRALLQELADVLLEAGRVSDAVDALQNLVDMLDLEGDAAGAAQAMEEMIGHLPVASPEQHRTLARFYEQSKSPSLAQDHLRRAAALFQSKRDFPNAISAMEQLLALAGDDAYPEDMAMAAAICAEAGQPSKAMTFLATAVETLNTQTSDSERKAKVLRQALEIEPLNAGYAIQLIDNLPAGQAMTEGLKAAAAMQAAGQHDAAVQVMTQVVALVPHDMSLRQQLFEPLRASGNKTRLRQELTALASDAILAGDFDAACEALDEAAELAETAQQHRTVAELNERARRLDHAAAQFAQAALSFAIVEKNDQAVASINRAMSAKPSAIETEIITELVRRLGIPVYDVAREQLRSSLSARKQKQSQMLALALIAAAPDRTGDILKIVYMLGGISILAGISHAQVNALLAAEDTSSALHLTELLMDIAPDASEVWHLNASVNKSAGNRESAVRAALEAARLYAIAGAVTEEEDSYLMALEAVPTDSNTLAVYAEFLVREHRPDEAVATLQKIVEQAELSGQADLQIEALNRAVQIAPGNADMREKLARLLENIAPDSAIDNWLQAASLYKEDGNSEKAHRIWQHVLSVNPRNEAALQHLLLEAYEDADLPTAASFSIRLANVKAARKNIGEACRILQDHLQLEPDNLEVLEQLSAFAGASNDTKVFLSTTHALAKKFQRKGDNAAAMRYYESLLERKPRDAELLTALLDCSAAAGNSEKGIMFARQLLAVAREAEDPERIRIAAATILNFDETDADARRELAESLLSLNKVPESMIEFLRAAELFEGAGNNANAFTCYRRVTQISPGTNQAWRRLTDLALSMGDLESARRGIHKILDMASEADYVRIKPLLERMNQTAGPDPAVSLATFNYLRRIQNFEQAAHAAVDLARQAIATGDFEAAEDYFQQAVAMQPHNRDIRQAHHAYIREHGRLEELQLELKQEVDKYLAAGDQANAIATLQELADISPGQVSVHKDLARLLESQDRLDDALQEHLKVLSLLLEKSELEQARDTAEDLVSRYPVHSHCRELVADVLAQSAYPDLAARYYTTAAEHAILRDDREKAVALLQKAIDARPLWTSARQAMAELYEKANQPEKAFSAWIGLVEAMLENGDFLEATSTLDRLARNYPDRLEVQEQLADLYEKTGRRAEYIAVLKELAKACDKDEARALEIYRRLTQADPDDAEAIQHYVDLVSRNSDPDGDLTDEYTRLAEVLARSGNIDGAIQTYEQILGRSPENTAVRGRYASFLLARGSRNRALAEMKALANIYLQNNDPAAAAEVLNGAMTISPRDAELCLELAKAQERAGMADEARTSYARATAILANTAAVKGIDTYRRILSVDETNTAVRLRLVELLMKAGDTMEAAREARTLAEVHISKGELSEAEHAYSLVDQCEPQSRQEIQDAIQRDSYDPSLQYLHYVRLGNHFFESGDVDQALDAYRTARSLHDDQTELIQKCIDCLSLIAPEAEAIPDYLVMAEKYLLAGDLQRARDSYKKVRMIDPFNNDARCGIESVNATEARMNSASGAPNQDGMVLGGGRNSAKRIALMDLLTACQEAAESQETQDDSGRLGFSNAK